MRLISSTSDAEKLILYIARVSSNQKNESPGLLRYLIKHEHWSPFEMAHMVIEIETSRSIAAQILRHRSFSFQEFSQRYAVVTEYEDSIARVSGSTNRQSSLDTDDEELKQWWEDVYIRQNDSAFSIYSEAVERGIAPEIARFILPLSTTTKLYISGSLRSWIHYIQLRTKEDTQLEHRQVAEEIKEIFIEQFPIISEALEWL